MRVEARGAKVFRAQMQQSKPKLDSGSSCRISMGVFSEVVGGFEDHGGQPRAGMAQDQAMVCAVCFR